MKNLILDQEEIMLLWFNREIAIDMNDSLINGENPCPEIAEQIIEEIIMDAKNKVDMISILDDNYFRKEELEWFNLHLI